MPDKADEFVQEFVLGFGFIGGLFTRFGIDPEIEIVNALLKALVSFNPSIEPNIPLILLIISALVSVTSIAVAYGLGGKLGLLSVALAFIAGLIIIDPSMQPIGELFIFVAMFSGWYSVSQKT